MYQKFIITDEGVLRFGNVYLHRDLLRMGEDASNGGGLWTIDEERRCVLLYGRSFDFGGPDFAELRRIEWGRVSPMPLFYLPHWPSQSTMEPVFPRS